MKLKSFFLVFVPLVFVGCASVYYYHDVKDRIDTKKLPPQHEEPVGPIKRGPQR